MLLIRSIVSNDSISGQTRPRSACANAQADLNLLCSNMLKASFPLALFTFQNENAVFRCLFIRNLRVDMPEFFC